jgi:hypothetical protein
MFVAHWHPRAVAVLCAGVLVVLARSAPATTSNGFVAYGVTNYSTVYTGSCNNQNGPTGGTSDATDFANALTTNGWVLQEPLVQTTDGEVNDTDFFDPDVTHNYGLR